jgi:hypothetical protein
MWVSSVQCMNNCELFACCKAVSRVVKVGLQNVKFIHLTSVLILNSNFL